MVFLDNETKTTVVHCKREPYDVYIGRPSKWGNPFVMRGEDDRKHVIQEYEFWLHEHPELMLVIREELHGKRLGCYCAPKRCHGNVLAMIADMDDEAFARYCRCWCEWW